MVSGAMEDKILSWQRSLRPLDPGVEEANKRPKPAWNCSRKWNSPSLVTNSEGGSLWTARKMQPRPPRPKTPPRERTPSPPPAPSPPPQPEPQPWRDKYQFEPLGPTLGRSNVIESAIKQIQEENILSIGHYPKDGVLKDTALDVRSNSRMSSGTYTLASSDTNFSGLESLRSRSRSKSPGVFSKSTLATRQKQRESVDYRFGQYAFSPDLPPPTPQPRPEPDWLRRHSTAGSQDSRISETRSFISSETSEKSNRRSSFKKSATKLSGPFPLWLDEDEASSKPERGY